MREILFGIDEMTLADLVTIAREDTGVRLTKELEKRIVKSRALI